MSPDRDGVPASSKPSSNGELRVSHSSKQRYLDYLAKRQRIAHDLPVEGQHAAASHADRRKRSRSFWTLLREFWGLLHGRRRYVTLAVGTVTVSTLLGLIPAATTKVVFDYILHPNPPGPDIAGLRRWLHLPESAQIPTDAMTLLWITGAVLLGVAIIGSLVQIWGRWHMTRLTKLLQASVRRRVFDHAVQLPLHRVYQIKSGGVASILREDAGGAAELLFSLLYNPWKAIVQLTGTLIILALVDWRLLLGGLLVIPAAYFSQKTWIARIRPVFTDIRSSRTAIDAHAAEAFGGMRVVRGFARERGEAARFLRGNHLMARQEMLAWWWSRILEIVWMLLLPLASTGVLIYGGWRVIHGTLTIGDVMMFSVYLLMLLGPLESLTNSATTIQNQLAGFDRVLNLLAEPVELGREKAARPGEKGIVLRTAEVRGRVTFRDVTFAYPGYTQSVLEDVSLDVPPGTTVALVGRSGAGKTTLCNLVARFYDATAGEILLDGTDIRTIDVASYRRLLGIVEQDVFLFDGTVAENIGYARRGASMDQIRAAAAAAHAAEFIEMLERGYATVIGERGVRLSGGQKQRIAIARALLADPRILILDEATSNLDTESEMLIQQSLVDLMRGRTCFVIAHRLSTIRHADRIVVLDHGRIVEMGRHEELLESGGRYAAMLELQLHPEDRKQAGAPGPGMR
jgi:ATP-binding cassette subfamily B protein/subfamily B ATP-binding cassette protein MsbA